MTTLIQRLRLMSDEAGANEVQHLLDELATAQTMDALTARENRALRQALASILAAQTDAERRTAEAAASRLLARPARPWRG
mgnify:CR=1 FL=1